MIALDTNLLIYAHRRDVPEHAPAQRSIERALQRGCGVALASIAEFWSIVTHPKADGGPSTPQQAQDFLAAIEQTGAFSIWSPGPGFASRLMQLAQDLQVTGVRVFDLQIGLSASENGATELWTHDKNFVRIPGLKLHDPLA